MNTVESTAGHAGHAGHDAGEGAHGPDHVHHYATSGIDEGNARVPRWLMAILIALFSFAAYYIVSNWDAQPTSARVK